MKSYTTSSRQNAAMICSAAACESNRRPYDDVMRELLEDWDHGALELAQSAWMEVRLSGFYDVWSPSVDAEAEALVQSGWKP